jgi:O-antigen/teichoic acid export membrane protein
VGNRSRLIKNAVANLARGGAIAAFSLLLPPFLVRHMQAATYTIWVLVLQAAAYIGYFDFGLQTALGRYIAFAQERKDTAQRDSMFSTSLLGLLVAGALSCVALLALIAYLPHFFPAVPESLLRAMRWTLLIVGGSLAVGLPASVCNGVFIGIQKNEIPAATIGAAKALAAAGIIIALLAGRSIITMALIVAFTNLLAYITQYAAMRKTAPNIRFKREAVNRVAARELFRYCFAITLMSVSMLLVSGFDVILVGRFQFEAVIAYSVSASFIPIIAGSLYAVLNAMMPHAAQLHAQGARRRLGDLVVSSTRLSVVLLVLTGLPIVIYAGPLLHLWIGPVLVPEARTILIVLLLANIIRLTGAAYTIILVAAGQQYLIKVSPMAEGLGNLAASIALGAMFGAVGVAFGTLIGSIISMGAHFFYNMPRTKTEILFGRPRLLWSGIALPLLCTSPLVAAAVYSVRGMQVSPILFAVAVSLSAAAGTQLLHRSQIAGTSIRWLRERWS